MSYLIGTAAIIVLIFVMQLSYVQIVDNLWVDMVKRQLKEITDQVSDTLANLYFLVNSTTSEVALEKVLTLPSTVRGSTYQVEIEKNSTTGFAQRIHAYIKRRSTVDSSSWLPPGLTRDDGAYTIESGGRIVVASCSRLATNVRVRLDYA